MAAFKMRETNPDFKFKVDENVDIEKVIADNADSVVEISLSEIKPFKFRNVVFFIIFFIIFIYI